MACGGPRQIKPGPAGWLTARARLQGTIAPRA